jgi:hypothetical protein
MTPVIWAEVSKICLFLDRYIPVIRVLPTPAEHDPRNHSGNRYLKR